MRSISQARIRAIVLPPISLLLLLLAASTGACAARRKDAARSPAADFPDSPLLALVPADTPYVMATFQPVPASYLQQVMPSFQAFRGSGSQALPGPSLEILAALADEIGPRLDAGRYEELGLSLKARTVFYGIGPYPVGRLEIADGDRLFATIVRVAARAKLALGEPTVRDGYRYWVIPGRGEFAVVVAIGARDVAGAIVPVGEVERWLPQILGRQKPARSLPMEVLRDLALRHHFTSYGVGYLDTVRLAAAIPAIASTQACRDAVASLAHRAPRVVLGYGDLSRPVIEWGAVVELAPDLAAQLQRLAVSTPAAAALAASQPMFGMSVAAHFDELRAVGGRLGGALQGAAAACHSSSLARMAGGLVEFAAAALPLPAAGVRGAALSVHDVQIQPGRPPTNLDGFVAVWADDAPGLVQLATSAVPQLAALHLEPDGMSRALLPGFLPFNLQAALRPTGVVVSTGPAGSRAAELALTGPAVPAPLLLFQYDYGRFLDFVAQADPGSPVSARLGKMGKVFGAMTLKVVAGDRGLDIRGTMQLH